MITVQAIGEVKAEIDLIVLKITLETKDTVYKELTRSAMQNAALLQEKLTAAGFAKETIRTASYYTQIERENIRCEDGSYTVKQVGFSATQEFDLAFEFDLTKLNCAVNAVADLSFIADFSITFTLSNKEKETERAMGLAVEIARKKANILTQAAHVRLGKLMSIRYLTKSEGNSPRAAMRLCNDASAFGIPDITPQNTVISVSVEIEWETLEN